MSDGNAKVHIIALNLHKRLALAEEGMGKITNYFDENGDEIQTHNGAVSAVIGWDFGGWTSTLLEEYDIKNWN